MPQLLQANRAYLIQFTQEVIRDNQKLNAIHRGTAWKNIAEL